jgi:mycofactocin glycosyltransferase
VGVANVTHVPLVLDDRVRRRNGMLVGGSQMRVLRLSEEGQRVLESLEQGTDASAVARALGRRLLDRGLAHPRPRRRERVAGVTIVVPARDRAAALDRCLSALGPDQIVTVVDDGSREPGAVAAVAARHGARVVRRATAGGPGAARNAALATIETDLIAFLDSDCTPEPGWLNALIGHFDDPEVGAVAPRIRPVPPHPGELVGRYLVARSPLDMGVRESAVEPGTAVSYVPTAALMVRRRALLAGFDSRLRYGEDVDLIWRMRDAGWRVRYDPRVTVAHEEPPGFGRALARRFRYGTSAGPLATRHRGRLAPVVLPAFPSAVLLLVLGRRPRTALALACLQIAELSQRLARVGLPRVWAVRWFGGAVYHSALSTIRYGAMFALPLALADGWRRRRPWALALLALPAMADWRSADPDLGPLRWAALALVDDAAYGAGVCWGCLRAGTLEPLVPAVRRL